MDRAAGARVPARRARPVGGEAAPQIVRDPGVERPVGAPQHVHHPAHSRFASSVNSTLPFSAFDTGQLFFASSAAFWNPDWSRPGTLPRVVRAMRVIFGAPSTVSS